MLKTPLYIVGSDFLFLSSKLKVGLMITTKETISKVKRQPSEWEKIIANEAIDKELISKNIQATPAAQFQKNKRPNQKVGQRMK